jgi:ubiquitin
MEFDIHVECIKCGGYGEMDTQHGSVNANGPWVEIIGDQCDQCEGGGLVYAGREHYDSVADLRADYPESFAKNLNTGEWV